MRTVSSAFLERIAASHKVAVEITILELGEEIATIATGISGSVTLDSTAATRGRMDVTIAGADLVPFTASDPLAPYGREIQIKRGIEHNGGRELVSLGIFRIDRTQISESSDGLQIRVSGGDRSVRVIDARFEEPYQVAAGTNYATAIEELVAVADASIQFDLTATTRTTPLLTANEGDDRWKLAQDMAGSLGHLLYFDGDGVCVSRPISSTGATAPAAQLVEGDGGLLLTADRVWTRKSTFNRVIATGENTGNGTPVRGVATDDNPLSPTYYYGPFGKVPRFYASPFITTTGQAEDAAAGFLARELGTTQTVDFGTVTNPALEPNDVARVTRLRAGIDEDHIIDALTIGLDAAAAMTGRTRAVVA